MSRFSVVRSWRAATKTCTSCGPSLTNRTKPVTDLHKRKESNQDPNSVIKFGKHA